MACRSHILKPVIFFFSILARLSVSPLASGEPVRLQAAVSSTYAVRPDRLQQPNVVAGHLVLAGDRARFVSFLDAESAKRSPFGFVRQPQVNFQIRYHPPYTADRDLATVPDGEFLATIVFDFERDERYGRFLIYKQQSSLCFHSVVSEFQVWEICTF